MGIGVFIDEHGQTLSEQGRTALGKDLSQQQLALRQLLLRAASVVMAVVVAGKNLDRVLAQEAQAGRAAVQDMAYACLRDYARLCAVRDTVLDRPVQDDMVACLLLVALQQLAVHGERAYVVVNEATSAAASLRPWARGLTNAVLRNVLRQGLLTRVWQDDEARWNYPQWWIDAVRASYPDDWSLVLTAGNQHPPLTLRVNLRQTGIAEYLAALDAAGIGATHLGDEAIRLWHPMPVQQLPGFSAGDVSVQDAGAQRAAHWLDVRDGQRVLDACCAPGGKTAHVLERADVSMTAVDHDANRLQRVRDNLTRLRLVAHCVAGDAGQPADWWDGVPYDRILADVPCSASGVARRHPDVKWLRRPSDIAGFARQQAAILDALWPLLAPGGKLLYVTCSVFPQENQQQIDSFLMRHDNAGQQPRVVAEEQLVPCEDYDGFFYALLEKI